MKIAHYTNIGHENSHPVGCCRFRGKHRQTSNCVTAIRSASHVAHPATSQVKLRDYIIWTSR